MSARDDLLSVVYFAECREAEARAEVEELYSGVRAEVLREVDDEVARLRAVIERVRAAARKAKDSNNAWDLDDLIRAALAEEVGA